MRRKDRLIESTAEVEQVLKEEELGYLATCGQDGQPMATPVNYIYLDGRIIFHCALAGRKLDNIRANPKVGFTVVRDAAIDRIEMTSYYTSVMAEGEAKIIEDPEEKKAAIAALTERLAAPGEHCSDSEGRRTCMVEIRVIALSGKRNRPKQ